MISDHLRKEILRLDTKERAALAHLLIHSIDGLQDMETEAEWLTAVERRLRNYEEGKSKTISWKEMQKKLSDRFHK